MLHLHYWEPRISFAIIIFFILIVKYLRNYFKTVYLAFKIPGPPAIPVLGNVLLINNHKRLKYLGDNIYEIYGPIVRIWISLMPVFIIADPNYIQTILGSSTNCPRKQPLKNIFYSILHNFVGEGLITNNGYKWKLHRKLIQPYFVINNLKNFINSFACHANLIIDDLNKSRQTDDYVNITVFVNKFVINVLHDAVLGNSSVDNSPFRKGQVLAPYRMMRPWLLFDSVFKLTANAKIELNQKKSLQNYVRQIIRTRNLSPSIDESNKSLLDMFLEISENNLEFGEDDVINELCTFMLAGQDSVGAALSFSLYFLAKNQQIQEKVFSELVEIFEDSNRPPTFDDISSMKYLEQCVKETLRLCPSVPIISRILIQDTVLGEHVMPKGTNILIAPFVTHRLQHIFRNPLEFEPDRFSEENDRKIHPYAYIPFSIGPRNCIGYKFALIEIKVLLCEILRNYHLSLKPGHENLNLSYRITLRAKGGIWLRLSRRTKENKT